MTAAARPAPWRVALLVPVVLLLAACASHRESFGGDSSQSPAEINAKLGLSYMQQGDYDVAMEKLQRALEQDPKLVSAHHYIAELYRVLGNAEAAEQHYRRALKLSPDDGALQNNYGVFLCERKRYDEAERRFLQASSLASYARPDEAYENAALCALREPDAEKAERYFRKALDINPRLPNSLYQMAQLSYDTGHYLQARAFMQRYSEAVAQTPKSLWLAAQIERKLGDTQAAARFEQQLRRDFPQAEETARLPPGG